MKSGKISAASDDYFVTLNFQLLVLLTVPAAATLLVLFVWWAYRRQQRDLLLANQLNQLGQQQISLLSTEVEELRSGLIGTGQRLLQAEQQVRRLEHALNLLTEQQQLLTEQQQKLELTDPDSRLYNRAVKMVQLGAPLEEVMRECELPRAEAELLFNLHSKA